MNTLKECLKKLIRFVIEQLKVVQCEVSIYVDETTTEKDLLTLEKRFNFYSEQQVPLSSWRVLKTHSWKDIFYKGIVLDFTMENDMIPQWFRSVTPNFLLIDYRTNALDAWVWHADLLNNSPIFSAERNTESFNKLLKLKQTLSFDKAYIFGTAPSLSEAIDTDFSDGVRVVCNTICKDKELWTHINPHIIVAGDGLYHFSDSDYACSFRRDLKKRLSETATLFVYPAIFNNLVEREFKDFNSQLIPMKIADYQTIHQISEKQELPNLGNALVGFLLPVACFYSQKVFMWGFDGRDPNDSQSKFWKNSDKHSYDLTEMTQDHPAFYNHYVPKNDKNKYMKEILGDTLEKVFSDAEAVGWEFQMTTFSWTAALAKRLNSPQGKSNC